MAPSRALLRCMRTTPTARCVLPRPSPRSFSAMCYTPSPTPAREPLTAVYPRIMAARPSPIRIPFSRATGRRPYSQEQTSGPEPPDYLSTAELHIFNKIKAELQPEKLEVQDISGGCGSMYALEIQSSKFNGLTMIKQHKLVNKILADEIKSWHGVQLRTSGT